MNTCSIVAVGCLYTVEKINCPDSENSLYTSKHHLLQQYKISVICLHEYLKYNLGQNFESHSTQLNLCSGAEAALIGWFDWTCCGCTCAHQSQPARCDSDLVWQFYGTGLKLWMYFLYSPLISHQLTTHKIHIITFWFSFSSHLCIQFSPIFLFLLEVSCSYISTVRLVHDRLRAMCTWWPGVSVLYRMIILIF